MEFSQLKNELKAALSKAELQWTMDELGNRLADNSSYYDDYVLLSARFYNNKRRDYLGSSSREEVLQENTKICQALLEMINNLQVKDVKSLPNEHDTRSDNQIHDKILIICKANTEKTDKAEIEEYFQKLGFTGVKVESTSHFIDPENSKMVIFDNHSVKNPDAPETGVDIQHQRLLKQYLDKKYFILYYGENTTVLRNLEYRSIAHAANSKFALYSRVREMLDFINRYEVQ